MWDGDCRHNAVRANRERDGGHRADVHHRKARTLDFLDHRCPATSAGASGGGEYDGIDPIGDELLTDFRTERLGRSHRRSIADRRVELVVQLADGTLALHLAQYVDGNHAIGILIRIGRVIAAMRRLVGIAREVVDASDAVLAIVRGVRALDQVGIALRHDVARSHNRNRRLRDVLDSRLRLDAVEERRAESGGQARGEIACITEIVIRINGKSSIKCVGENPRLNQAKSRYTKDIEGLLAQNDGIEGTSTFWMSDAYSPSDMAVSETETVVTATQFEIQTDKSRGEVIWTGTYTLDEPSVVTANVYLDDQVIYSCRDWRMSGNVTLSVSTPFEIRRGDEGVHEVKVTLSCRVSEESDLTILMRRFDSLENRVRQIEEGFENEISVEDFILCSLDGMFGRVESDVTAETGIAGNCEITEPQHVELTGPFGSIIENAEGET